MRRERRQEEAGAESHVAPRPAPPGSAADAPTQERGEAMTESADMAAPASREWLCKARAKSPYGAARLRMVPHLIVGDLAVARHRGRLRFAAKWLCGGGSYDMVVVPNPDPAMTWCDRCLERHRDLNERGGPAVVYRLFSESDELLYVGSTGNPVWTRFSAHSRAAWWAEVGSFTTEHYPHVLAARAAEVRAIREGRPKYNVKDVAS